MGLGFKDLLSKSVIEQAMSERKKFRECDRLRRTGTPSQVLTPRNLIYL
ncbi:MAG: hypothetical protein V7K25_26030 [Nostoc sp.]